MFPSLYSGSRLYGMNTSLVVHLQLRSSSCRIFSVHAHAFSSCSSLSSSQLKFDHRSRLSRIWAPTGGIAASDDEGAHSKLIRAGFLRQAYSGIFHMLPLGRRVQDKVERLIDRHMSTLGASRLDLSSISSEELWRKSGRLADVNSELFHFKDRKQAGYLLSPTHEEEITSLVASTIKSYKDLPTRLYQISRKYRDELRPRHGLLRSREFIMKDLYTFDCTDQQALETYEQVRKSYAALFNELKISYLVAEADSGDMGGSLSHEYHVPVSIGEDNVVSCDNCDYVANEELAKSSTPQGDRGQEVLGWTFSSPRNDQFSEGPTFTLWRGISRNRLTLVNVWYPGTCATGALDVSTHAVKQIVSDLDASVKDAVALWKGTAHVTSHTIPPATRPKILNLIDHRLPANIKIAINSGELGLPVVPPATRHSPSEIIISTICQDPSSGQVLNLLRIKDGDPCSRCNDGSLKVQKAIELGHTFFLGTRYSEPLDARVNLPVNPLVIERKFLDSATIQEDHSLVSSNVPIQMGCHGIGVSRMIGAVAEFLVDEKGLNWPRVIAPYEAVIVPVKGLESAALTVYDTLSPLVGFEESNHVDTVLDDREHSFPWKMKDADLVGYPVIVVVGKGWKINQSCEVQCRRLGVRENIALQDLVKFVTGLLTVL